MKKIFNADYKKIEEKILAFDSYPDLHVAAACKLFKVKSGQVTSEMRRLTKVISFYKLYGRNK